MASNQLPAPAPSLEQDTGDVSRVAAQLASAQVEDSADKPPVTDSRRWQPVQFLSRSPGSRVFPSAVVHNNLLYVFGGHDGTVYRNDLLVFNFETRCWVTQLETLGDAPSPRDAHAAVVHVRARAAIAIPPATHRSESHGLPLTPRARTPRRAPAGRLDVRLRRLRLEALPQRLPPVPL